MKNKKKYIAHCYELDTNTRYTVYWTIREHELAQHLVRMGAISLIEGKGYFYWFENLKKGLAKIGHNPYWQD